MEAGFIRRYRNLQATAKLSLLVLFAMALGVAAPVALATEPAIDSIVVKLRDGALADPAAIGGLNGPDNIAFGPDGYLYVGEKYGGRVIRIAADGTHSVFALGFDNIEGVAFDPQNGNLYIGEIEKSTLWRVRN